MSHNLPNSNEELHQLDEPENSVVTDNYFTKMEESLQRKSIQSVINDIGEYSDALSKTKGVKKISELKLKLRENFTLVGEKCLETYEKEYGKMPEYEQWIFMESVHFVPDEGHMSCLLMTQAIPCEDDYDGDQLITTQSHRAVREFHKEFGTFSLHSLNFHPREIFFQNYFKKSYGLTSKLRNTPCNLTFKTKLEYNFP
jgi:hypothetical protein